MIDMPASAMANVASSAAMNVPGVQVSASGTRDRSSSVRNTAPSTMVMAMYASTRQPARRRVGPRNQCRSPARGAASGTAGSGSGMRRRA
jgi:hypothetical protein